MFQNIDSKLICKSPKLGDIYRQKQPFLQHKLTPYIYILFFFLQLSGLIAQNHKLKFQVNSSDSKDWDGYLNPIAVPAATDSIRSTIDNYIHKLELKGYLRAQLDSLHRTDSLSVAHINLGPQLTYISIDYSHIPSFTLREKDLGAFAALSNDRSVKIPFSEIQNFMNTIVAAFEKKGDSFMQLSLTRIELISNEANAKLMLDQNIQRKIDKVIIKGYENFPHNFIEHELGLKIGSVFNNEKIKIASMTLNNIGFANELKPPETLFTQDSTIVYLYLKKKRSNQFDGIIGFASKEESSGLEFNGYLDLTINNIFNGGETIALFWKNNGNDRQRFYLEAEAPYLFNLPITPKVNFELYRQDSTFNNIKTNISLLYRLSGKGQIAGHFRTENSNDLSTGQTPGVASFSNLFYGVSYNYEILSTNTLFPVKFNMTASALLGSRKIDSQTNNQSKFNLKASYLHSINQSNHIFLGNLSGLLNSDDFLENELFRIGGTYNLRGVNEESIFASNYTIFNLEYRFQPTSSSYLYTITDYSYSENKLIDANTSVLSFGFGYAFQTKAGIINLSYANGTFNNIPFSFDNSKVHIKIISKF